MGRSRVLDPATRDYIRDGATRRKTSTIEPKIYHALRAHRGAWVGDPDRGSRLWQIARGNVSSSTPAAARDAIEEALGPFVSEGLARDLEVRVEVDAPSRLVIESSIVDTQGGAIDLSDVTRFTE